MIEPRKSIVSSVLEAKKKLAAMFALLLPMMIGLNDPVIGGLSWLMLVVVLVIVLAVGVAFIMSKGLKEAGKALSLSAIIILFVVVIAMAVAPAAQVSPGTGNGQFSVITVSDVGGANYSLGSKMFTVAATVNKTAHTIGPSSLYANFTVQRTDAGQSTDIKTVTASFSQTTRTDPTTGLSYKAIASNSFGVPNLDWQMAVGGSSVAATDTLTAQMGLTPYENGVFNATIHWSGYAFSTSDVTVNDVLYAGTLTIGSDTYSFQVVVKTVLP